MNRRDLYLVIFGAIGLLIVWITLALLNRDAEPLVERRDAASREQEAESEETPLASRAPEHAKVAAPVEKADPVVGRVDRERSDRVVEPPRGFQLIVRGADTGEELHEVEVRRHSGPAYGNVSWGPRTSEEVVKGVASPVTIPSAVSSTYYVRAVGYSWAELELAPTRGGSKSIMLWPATLLDVHLRGTVPAEAVVFLRVREMTGMAQLYDAIKDQPGVRESIFEEMVRAGFLDLDDEEAVARYESLLDSPMENPAFGTLRSSHRITTERPGHLRFSRAVAVPRITRAR